MRSPASSTRSARASPAGRRPARRRRLARRLLRLLRPLPAGRFLRLPDRAASDRHHLRRRLRRIHDRARRRLALIPDELSAVDAAPLMCAGITTFNALRNSGARPGDLVAVLGIGGLGHLGVQFAAKMGFRTVAIARGQDKEPLARQLGAWSYIDSQAQDPAAELLKLGGAKVILATVTSGEAMSAVLGGLGVNGTLMVLGAPRAARSAGDSADRGTPLGQGLVLRHVDRFAGHARLQRATGVRSMNEVFPLERAAEAYDRMMSGKARFRVVLTAT